MKMEKGLAFLLLPAAVSFMRMEAQHFQCAGEGGPRTGEVRTPWGWGEELQEDEQRGKGRRKG